MKPKKLDKTIHCSKQETRAIIISWNIHQLPLGNVTRSARGVLILLIILGLGKSRCL